MGLQRESPKDKIALQEAARMQLLISELPASELVVLKSKCAPQSPRGLPKTQIAGPHPRVSDPGGPGGAHEFTALTSSQVIVVMLI